MPSCFYINRPQTIIFCSFEGYTSTMINARLIFKKSVILVVPYALLLFFLLNTNPLKLPVVLLFIPFILFFLSTAITILYFLSLFTLKKGQNRKRNILRALCLGALPTTILALQSINQLTLRDGLILFAFIALLVLYIGRANFIKH